MSTRKEEGVWGGWGSCVCVCLQGGGEGGRGSVQKARVGAYGLRRGENLGSRGILKARRKTTACIPRARAPRYEDTRARPPAAAQVAGVAPRTVEIQIYVRAVKNLSFQKSCILSRTTKAVLDS